MSSPLTISHFQGGRHDTNKSDEESPTTTATTNNNKNDTNYFDNDLPEGVDFSQGGWAADFAVALTGLTFFISGLVHYSKQQQHVLYMHAGTAVAHFLGGLAHRYFPNRAADGVGMPGFYVTMVAGYGGNCVRFAMGWDLEEAWWPLLGVLSFVYLVLTATWTVCRMERAKDKIDDAQGVGFKPDSVYALGELVVAILEVTAGVMFLLKKSSEDDDKDVLLDNPFIMVAVVSNILGWFAVYGIGGFAFICGYDYNPGLMQRLFHYAMMIMLWGMNEYALQEANE